MRHSSKNRPRRTAVAGAPREHDSGAIRRPDRRDILTGGRREINQRRVLRCKNSDERVIPTVGNEREPSSIRRPDQTAVLAAVEEQSFRLAALEGRTPND